jgi:6-phosphogluconolactonase (cycloisomerase 2 family)
MSIQKKQWFKGWQRLGALVLLLALLAAAPGHVSAAADTPGAVYTLSNAAGGNAVLVYNRSADGSLAFAEAVPTGGLGSGSGLGSQGSIILSDNGRFLFAVNAGSNEVSIFRVTRPGEIELVDVVDSGGMQPISLTVWRDLLYVLNAGGSGNITGFQVSNDGELAPLAGSTALLSNGGVGAAPGPAQVSFSPDGSFLVVTEKATNLIDVYTVEGGLAAGPQVYPSAGQTPFGFAFGKDNLLVVSEAFGGAADASALSSYQVIAGGLEVISASAATTETAACWVVVTKNGRYTYTTNAGSSSVSGYSIRSGGELSLLDADGKTGFTGAGSAPIDAALDVSSQHLYVLSGGSNTITAFALNSDGSLASIGSVAVPAGSVGLAAR